MTVPRLSPHASPVAKEIYRRMTAKKLSPKALSLRSGLNPGYVRDLFRARSKNPKGDELTKLATALGCLVDDLRRAPGSDQEGAKLAQQIANEKLLLDVWGMLTPEERQRVIVFMIGLIPARNARA